MTNNGEHPRGGEEGVMDEKTKVQVLTDEQVAEAEARAAKATKGPWTNASGRGTAVVKAADCAVYLNINDFGAHPDTVRRWKADAEFIAHAKRNPGKLTYGTPGNGTSPHIAGEMLKSQAGFFSVHIPYRGSGAALQDLLGGTIDYLLDPGIAFPHVRSGRLRLLAVTSPKRLSMFPDAPTLEELGLKGFDAGTTHGFWAPAGTPAAIIERMNREINRALMLPAAVEAIRGIGAEPTPMSAAEFGAVTKADARRFAQIIKDRNIVHD